MNAQHTPGPWTISELYASGEKSDQYIFIEPGVAVIERKIEGQDQCDMPDAHLIAAAPSLLAALEMMVERSIDPPAPDCRCHISPPCNDCVENWGLREAFEYARAAIAKATGVSA
ncbi:hypothetical protein [Hydrogenophaga sp.]|uniref:hypothetical protein n=1 Tax=Hydrogenophaga sp. TaxID=1904254 RepID=UPI0008BE50CE|nr:hypothetical protein [Hydrogenophaga sp.]OGA89367.1 MAG: hypothetical protein A2X72_16700 [Burkholderiales bacterium GWF1_66_17]HBU17053.1 hypothetical protein [Hydrogenophaga sp.]